MATNKNIIYINDTTKCIKIATHCIFDEAGITLSTSEQSPAQTALQKAGYRQDMTSDNTDNPESTTEDDNTDLLVVKLLSENARKPIRSTPGTAGYDIFSAINSSLDPGQRGLFPLDIQITPPHGTYTQIKSRSGISVKHNVDVQAGVIDADYTGNVTVVLHNYGTTPFQVNIGDKIAQLLLIKVATPEIHTTTADPPETQRVTKGFGSTDRLDSPVAHSLQELTTASLTDGPSDENNTPIELPYHIYISNDPFDLKIDITILVKGDHPTLGMQLTQCDYRQCPHLMGMALSTPASRIPKWRSQLRNAYLVEFNHQPIHTMEDAIQQITNAKEQKLL
jgi:dUTP pyrophosphatase